MDYQLMKNIFNLFQYDVNQSDTITAMELCDRFSPYSEWAMQYLKDNEALISYADKCDKDELEQSNEVKEPMVAGELAISISKFLPVNFDETSDFLV